MPFDSEKYRAPATHGELGGVALDVAIALSAISDALKRVAEKSGADVDENLKGISKSRDSLWKAFVDLTGYEPPE